MRRNGPEANKVQKVSSGTDSSIGDTPEIESIAVPSYEPRGPYGAKEVGEGSMVPVLGSIANAIYDAVGVRMTELPITPQKILAALEEKRLTVETTIQPPQAPLDR